MFGLRGRLDEEVALLVGVLDSFAGDVEIFGLYLDADELEAELDASNAGGADAG